MRALLVTVAIGAFAFPATADHCETWSTSTSGAWGVFLEAGPYYAFTDCWTYDPQCNPSFWVYEETNGIRGLQRGDETVDDACHGQIRSDTIVV